MVERVSDFTEHLEFSAKLIGLASFSLGTLLFMLQLVEPKGGLEILGVYFIGYAFVINALFFLILLIAAAAFYHRRMPLLKTAGLLLINIPIAIVYFLVLINLNAF